MVRFPVLLVAVSSFLANYASGVPVPTVEVGQVVSVAADQTLGMHYAGPGAAIAHPHIVLEKDNGKVVLAPVTHAPDEKNGPFMKHAGDFHPNLEGNILLHHVTADENNIPNVPMFRGTPVDRGAVEKIKQAKTDAAVKVYEQAEDANRSAAKALHKAEDSHLDAATKWKKSFQQVDDLVNAHTNEANRLSDEASARRAEAKQLHKNVKEAEKGVPLTYADYHAAQTSKEAAQDSKRDAKTSRAHAKAAIENIKASVANNNAAAPLQKGKPKDALEKEAWKNLQRAQAHSPSNPNKPDPKESKKDAHNSLKAAEKMTKSSQKKQ